MDQTIWKKYSEEFGARFTARQKEKFRRALMADFEELGYKSEIVEGKKFLTKARNVMFGSLKHAKTVIAVPYDTPQKVYWLKSYFFPLDGMATANKSLLPVFGPVLALYLILLVLMYGLDGFVSEISGVKVAMTVIILLIIVVFYMMLHGITNKKNYNRNSAGIYAAYEIAKALTKDERRNVVFLFVDSNRTKHLGARIAAEDFLKQTKNPNVIVLNGFANGSNMQLGYNANNKKLAQDINKVFPNGARLKMVQLTNDMRTSSPMEHFSKAVTIGAGEFDKKGRLCVMGTGTSKDTIIQEENIEKVITMVGAFLK